MMLSKRHICIFVALFTIHYVSAQLRYPVVGAYKGKSAQGMAIWKDNAYIFNDGGHCRVFDLKKKCVVYEFDLASSGKNTHVNAAVFGVEYVRNSDVPLLYISEYKSPSRCFVESIQDSISILVQTISIQYNNKPVFVQSWLVDNTNGFLYAIARMNPAKGENNSKRIRISKFRLPHLDDGEHITLREKDCLDSFFVEFASGTQGGVIKGKFLYVASGLQESARGRYNAQRAIQIIDLKKKKIVKSVDLTYVTTNEPEDLDFYNGKALLYCGQEGGIYQVKIK